jgi:hypothetical protein
VAADTVVAAAAVAVAVPVHSANDDLI